MPLLVLLLVGLALRAVTLPGAGAGLAYYLSLRPDTARRRRGLHVGAGPGVLLPEPRHGMHSHVRQLLQPSGRHRRVPRSGSCFSIPRSRCSPGSSSFPSGSPARGSIRPRAARDSSSRCFRACSPSCPAASCSARRSFLLLGVAALTSTISLLEVPVSHCVDARGWSRRKAVGVVAARSPFWPSRRRWGTARSRRSPACRDSGSDFSISWSTSGTSSLCLSAAASRRSSSAGYGERTARSMNCERKGAWFPAPRLWTFLIRWVCPAAIASIIVAALATMF